MAVVLGDVATGYVLNAAKLHDQEQLSQQLQQALDSRVVSSVGSAACCRKRSKSCEPPSVTTSPVRRPTSKAS